MKTSHGRVPPALAALLLTAATAAAPVAAQAPAISDSHRTSVIELLEVMQVEKTLEASMDTMLELLVGSQPGMEAVRPTFEAFFAEYFTWQLLQDRFVELYASTFTEPEVRDLIAFFRTPTGQRFAGAAAELSEQGAQIGQQQFMDHLPEFERMLMESVPAAADPSARPPWQQR